MASPRRRYTSIWSFELTYLQEQWGLTDGEWTTLARLVLWADPKTGIYRGRIVELAEGRNRGSVGKHLARLAELQLIEQVERFRPNATGRTRVTVYDEVVKTAGRYSESVDEEPKTARIRADEGVSTSTSNAHQSRVTRASLGQERANDQRQDHGNQDIPGTRSRVEGDDAVADELPADIDTNVREPDPELLDELAKCVKEATTHA